MSERSRTLDLHKAVAPSRRRPSDLHVYVSDETDARLARAAKELGVTKSGLAAFILETGSLEHLLKGDPALAPYRDQRVPPQMRRSVHVEPSRPQDGGDGSLPIA